MHGPRPFKEEKRNSNYELKGRTLPPQSQKQEHVFMNPQCHRLARVCHWE